MAVWPLAAFVIWMLVGCGWASFAESSDTAQLDRERARARELKEQLDKAKNDLQKTLRGERKMMDHLDLLDRQLDLSRKAQRQLEDELLATQSGIEEFEGKVEKLRREVDQIEGAFYARLVALYKAQRTGYPAQILAAADLHEALRQSRYLLSVVQEDVLYLRRAHAKISAWEEAKAELVRHREKLIELQRAQQQQQHMISVQRREKRLLLAALENREDLLQRTVREVQEAADRLQELIGSLEESAKRTPRKTEKSPSSHPGFASLRTRLPAPVRGNVRSAFGRQIDPQLKTFTVHNGIEIEAPEGEEIRAIHPGTIVFAGWVKGYGNVVIIDHGGGYYTLSGHASRLLKGVADQVQEGDAVALVGDTGSLGGASLYFEIREGGKPVDPLMWIRSPTAKAGTVSAGAQ